MTHNEQEKFWANTYEKKYQHRNSSFDEQLGIDAWNQIPNKAEGISSFLECGSNIGRNLKFLNKRSKYYD